jgi:hypothetical protein
VEEDDDKSGYEIIEVTPEMCDAGREAAQEFYLGELGYALTDDALAAIFRKMIGAKTSPRHE